MVNEQDNIPGCSHFKWRDALYLPSWNVCHIPSDSEVENLTKLFQKLEVIRNFFGHPINVHCAIRPILNNPGHPKNGQDYNLLVKGASSSSHIKGLAVDFDVSGLSCDEAKAKLISKLQEFNIRLENNGQGATWLHVDLSDPHPNRYFIP